MKKQSLVIEMDDYVVKLMQARAVVKGWSVDKFTTEDITGKTEDETSVIIKDAVHKRKFKKQNIVFIIPRSIVTVRALQLPTNNANELRNMVDMQAVRQIPYAKEEMVYDYYITGVTEEGYTKVIIAIVHKNAVAKYINILEKAGIVPDAVELDSLAVIELCKYLNSKDAHLGDGEEPAVILDVDYSNTNIVIVQNNVPVFTRAVSVGSAHISGKISAVPEKDWLGEWTGEINRSLTAFQKEQASPINKIILFGTNSVKIISQITDKLGYHVDIIDLAPYIEGISLQDVNASIVSLLGAVRQGVDTSVNLIPQEAKNKRLAAKRTRSLAVTVLLLVAIFGTLGFTFNKKVHDRKKYLSKLEKKLKETGPSAKELTTKKDRLALIRKQLSVEGTSLDVLRELYTIIPQKTSLNVFIYDDAQGVTIKGASPAMSEVFELVPKMENSQYFEKVTTRSATQRKVKGQDLTDFQIDCLVTKPQEKVQS